MKHSKKKTFVCTVCSSTDYDETENLFICKSCGNKFYKDTYKEFQENSISIKEASAISEGLKEIGDIPWDEIEKDLKKLEDEE